MTNPSKEDQKPSAISGRWTTTGPRPIDYCVDSSICVRVDVLYQRPLRFLGSITAFSRSNWSKQRPGNHPLRFVCPKVGFRVPLTKPATYGVDGSLIPAKPGEVLKREFDVLIPSDSSSRSALLDRLNKLRQETKTVRDVDNPDSLSMAPLEYKVVPGSALYTVMTFLCSAFSCDGDRNLHIFSDAVEKE